ncbi:MAG: trypsin-like peptidase domain-containing protein [Anaerolineae bacterium]|nr:trypsin-like peptidase domain-containing protein [Anaerolineae bacterium]
MKKYAPVWVLVVLLFTALSCQTPTYFRSLTNSTAVPTAAIFQQAPQENNVNPPSAAAQNGMPGGVNDLSGLYERVSPGVVSIQVLTSDSGGQGSGFVYDNSGYIITNEHVVEGAQEVYVNFSSGLKVHGNVVAEDPDSDLAVIKVEVNSADLAPVILGDSDQVKVGQTVVAIGNPYGLSGTMTEGIVSAKGRTLDSLRLSNTGNPYSSGDIIQTDASINPGNSGGPLLNLAGEVIGINRAIRTSGTSISGDPVNTGIGFAIPINIVKKVVPVLIQEGHYDYPYLGVTAREELILPEIEALDLPRTTGAYIVDVAAGGPADRAGLRSGKTRTSISGLLAGGDLIIAVDQHPVNVFGDLLGYLLSHKSPGDTITITIIRDGQQQDVEVTLDKRE